MNKRLESKFKIGNKVKIKKGVISPKWGLGNVKVLHEIGTITGFDKIFEDSFDVRFPSYSGWIAYAPEMEIVAESTQSVEDSVSAKISGIPKFKVGDKVYALSKSGIKNISKPFVIRTCEWDSATNGWRYTSSEGFVLCDEWIDIDKILGLNNIENISKFKVGDTVKIIDITKIPGYGEFCGVLEVHNGDIMKIIKISETDVLAHSIEDNDNQLYLYPEALELLVNEQGEFMGFDKNSLSIKIVASIFTDDDRYEVRFDPIISGIELEKLPEVGLSRMGNKCFYRIDKMIEHKCVPSIFSISELKKYLNRVFGDIVTKLQEKGLVSSEDVDGYQSLVKEIIKELKNNG